MVIWLDCKQMIQKADKNSLMRHFAWTVTFSSIVMQIVRVYSDNYIN